MVIALTIALCIAILIYHYNFLGLGLFKSIDTSLPEASSSKESKSMSIDDDGIDEMKSTKTTASQLNKNKHVETAYDGEINDAFGDGGGESKKQNSSQKDMKKDIKQ